MSAKIEVQATLYAVKEPRWLGNGKMVSLRCKGPGSKNADGTWSAVWLDVLASGSLADQLAQVEVKSEFTVIGQLKAGADWTDKDGQVRTGGLCLWADALPGLEVVPAPEVDPPFDDSSIPF